MDWRSKMTLTQIVEQLKKDNPTIQEGSDDLGYTTLDPESYELKIDEWAKVIESKIKIEKQKAQRKADVLERLGITEEEAKLLLS